MKIVLSATGPELDSQVDPRFGRCTYLILYDLDTQMVTGIQNESAGATHGAGISAAQKVVEQGASSVITGNVGPNAMRVFQNAGVNVYITPPTTVRDAIEAFKENKLEQTTSLGQPGMGMGLGRGGGGGRGRRGGGGGGFGRGMGGFGGMIYNKSNWPEPFLGDRSSSYDHGFSPESQSSEIALREKIRIMEEEIENLKRKIESFESSTD